MQATLRGLNLTLALALEIGMLAAFGFAGLAATEIWWLRWVLMLALPALAIVLWAVWAAPRARKRRLKGPALLLFKVVMFGAAAALLWASGQAAAGGLFAVLAAINLLAGMALGQE